MGTIVNRSDAVDITKLDPYTLQLLVEAGEITDYGQDKPEYDIDELAEVVERLHLLEFYQYMPKQLKLAEEAALHEDAEDEELV